ncbi:PIN domain nuclease of toxin-antitoxin system [Paraburkholderia atlantica]|uniref:PilT protein domain protein n=1 Tax=Paraburkholderia atlantica TaxID=2654982 RepID=D5WL97_PARAM|nr:MULTISPECIES: type II toxin-antitoxin system VapC family toxin [Paraburkholderia]ADG19993.1 PilT protein domain protein [Paraburkholderia atlantica]MBB5414621.1 PIN domain nuclease of toxin-antitoxin system [Paraburkholderia atlantica]MBB5507866.1 PIN domain nuclease of toxin-antitoxin system [Paraburkholderia atlantica]MPW05301.1 PIN domain-containing protein [Paraburkholderia atlantica]NUX53843.1 type II toxin-antitoxin system VapC family toxin [Paraburkholderia youngii]
MRLLLDTHVFLWAVTDDRKLTKAARKLILDASEVFVSSASIWEASIKAGLGKLEVDVNLLVSEIEASGFLELPVRAVHAALVRDLPDIHKDPFDRLLVAQALSEPLRLLSSDGHLSKYTDLVIAV